MIFLRISRGIFPVALALATSVFSVAQVPAKKTQPPKTVAPASANPVPETDAAQQHFDSAQTYQLAGNLENAAKEYRRSIAIGLDHLGNLRAARQDYTGAAALLQEAIAEDPDNPDPLVDLAISELYSGDITKAETDVKTVLQRNPEHFRARVLLGKINFLHGNYQAAADELQTALNLSTDFDVAYSLALADLELVMAN